MTREVLCGWCEGTGTRLVYTPDPDGGDAHVHGVKCDCQDTPSDLLEVPWGADAFWFAKGFDHNHPRQPGTYEAEEV